MSEQRAPYHAGNPATDRAEIERARRCFGREDFKVGGPELGEKGVDKKPAMGYNGYIELNISFEER